MRDYCSEIIKKEKLNTVITLFLALVICSVMFLMLIEYMMQSQFQIVIFIVTAVIGLSEICLIVKLLRSPFKTENLSFCTDIIKQSTEDGESLLLDTLLYDINSDLNCYGKELKAAIIGQKWLIIKTGELFSSSRAIRLDTLQAFAVGVLMHSQRKSKPALIIISSKLGPITCYGNKNTLNQAYMALQSQYPNLTESTGDGSAIDLGEWQMRQYQKARQMSW